MILRPRKRYCLFPVTVWKNKRVDRSVKKSFCIYFFGQKFVFYACFVFIGSWEGEKNFRVGIFLNKNLLGYRVTGNKQLFLGLISNKKQHDNLSETFLLGNIFCRKCTIFIYFFLFSSTGGATWWSRIDQSGVDDEWRNDRPRFTAPCKSELLLCYYFQWLTATKCSNRFP